MSDNNNLTIRKTIRLTESQSEKWNPKTVRQFLDNGQTSKTECQSKSQTNESYYKNMYEETLNRRYKSLLSNYPWIAKRAKDCPITHHCIEAWIRSEGSELEFFENLSKIFSENYDDILKDMITLKTCSAPKFSIKVSDLNSDLKKKIKKED